jgi:NitT/TauT family transport system ATP-binding protein
MSRFLATSCRGNSSIVGDTEDRRLWTLCCDSVSKTFEGRHRSPSIALQNVSLRLQQDSRYALIGPNGSGKSTLLRILAGVELPSTGSRITPGAEPTVFWMPQDYRFAFLPWFTLKRNVELLGRTHGNNGPAWPQFANTLERLGLRMREETYPYTMSGGEQQLCLLAMCLSSTRSLLLLDEPLAAVDYGRRQIAQQLVCDVLYEHPSQAICVATHDFEEAILWADSVYVLSSREERTFTCISVDLPWPRTIEMKGTPAFRDYVNQAVEAVL